MLQEVIIRNIRGFSPYMRAQLVFAAKEKELQNLKPNLNRTFPFISQPFAPPMECLRAFTN
jgi:hypothetical protein